jgi:6-pyruvoyltetrahydropterin/6-carboxytetrahydropterin synthase
VHLGAPCVKDFDSKEVTTRKHMKAHLSRRYLFSASHRLHSEEMSAEENQTTYGKCNNPYGHGHNYIVQVMVSGPVDLKTGMVCNLADLDAFIEREVLARYGHQNLNTLQEFAQDVPTTENLCIQIYEIVKRGFHEAHLERVRLEETMMNSFEYAGEGS